MRRLDGHTNVITRLLATPDGRWLISSSYDHTDPLLGSAGRGYGQGPSSAQRHPPRRPAPAPQQQDPRRSGSIGGGAAGGSRSQWTQGVGAGPGPLRGWCAAAQWRRRRAGDCLG